jgi:hypothetical protein
MKVPTEYLMRYLNDINVYSHLLIQGYNADVDSSAWEDLTSVGGTYNALSSSGEHIHLVSNSAEDDPDKGAGVPGTGAHSVKIFYIDADGYLQSETIAMNGAAAVISVATNIAFLNGAYVVDSGTGKCAAGTILIKNAAETLTIGQIGPGESQAFLGIYKVPKGYIFDVTGRKFSSYISGSGISLSYTRLLIENWNRIAGTLVTTNSEHYYEAVYGSEAAIDLLAPIPIPEGKVLRLQAKGTADDNLVTGWVEGFLYKSQILTA